jgi:hypothetical protein
MINREGYGNYDLHPYKEIKGYEGHALEGGCAVLAQLKAEEKAGKRYPAREISFQLMGKSWVSIRALPTIRWDRGRD